MVFLYRTLVGYVKILIHGDNPEQLINIFVSEGIAVWGLKRNSRGILCCISMSDYKRMLGIRRRAKSEVHIKLIGKYGAPTLYKAIIRRPGMIMGLCFLVLINIFLSQFVWCVEIRGAESLNQKDITNACEEVGIRKGMSTNSLDTYTASQKLLLELKGAAWLSINVEGSVVTVNVSEAEESKKQAGFPCNLVAICDGVIRSYKIINGEGRITVGQAVREGDILISGIIESEDAIETVSAEGEIVAETERIFSSEIPKKYTCERLIDSKHKCALEVFGISLPLYLTDIKNAKAVHTDSVYIRISGKNMPIGLHNKRFEIYENAELSIDENEARQIAMMRITEVLRTFDIYEIDACDISVTEDDDSYKIRAKLKCKEEISIVDHIEDEY